jgi:hypothetical protein
VIAERQALEQQRDGQLLELAAQAMELATQNQELIVQGAARRGASRCRMPNSPTRRRACSSRG